MSGEFLDRKWLMGVRRGWGSLLHPKIESWSDVIKAFDALIAFVDNLRQQVTYVRQAPSLQSLGKDSQGKDYPATVAAKAFDELRDSLVQQRRWADSYFRDFKGLGLDAPTESETQRARKALGSYRDDFEGSLKSSVLEKKGGQVFGRSVPTTDLLEQLLAILTHEVEFVERMPAAPGIWGVGASTSFDLFGMKVVVEDESLPSSQIKKYLRRFDEAHALLAQKGLDAVWRGGTVLIQCESCGGANKYDESYSVAAHYKINTDTLAFFERPQKSTAYVLIHELGHRYWYKHLTQTQRQRFGAFVRVRRPGRSGLHADEARSFEAVSDYGRAHVSEAFAELFAFYVFGRDVDHRAIEFFREVIPSAKAGHSAGAARRKRSRSR